MKRPAQLSAPPRKKKEKEPAAPPPPPSLCEDVFLPTVKALSECCSLSAIAVHALPSLGILRPLTFLVQPDNATQSTRAAIVELFQLLGRQESNRPALDKAGAVPLLIGMLRADDPVEKAIAAEGICGLAGCAGAAALLDSAEAFEPVMALLRLGHVSDGAMWAAGIVRNL